MYKIGDFHDISYSPKFSEVLTSRWDELYNNTNIFHYKIDKLEERIVDQKYILQLNPGRRAKKRAPGEVHNVSQPFDKNKFNFTKISSKEILLSLQDNDSDVHTVLVNDSPITRYHSLLCPSINNDLPQIATAESLALVVEVLFIAQNRDFRILFNSLCGFASVNHLRYHLCIENKDLPVENVKWHNIKDSIYKLDNSYPAPAFCFEVQKHTISQLSKEIYKVIDYLLRSSIAYNILLTRRHSSESGDKVRVVEDKVRVTEDKVRVVEDKVRVILWPRRSTAVAKVEAIDVASFELSGWFPLYDTEVFKNYTAEDLERDLKKCSIEDFDKLCDDIKYL